MPRTYAYDHPNRMWATTLPAGTGVVSSYNFDDANRFTAISHAAWKKIDRKSFVDVGP